MKILHALFTTCPRTGRITGIRKPAQLPLLLFPMTGLLALIWFLIRVVPKPSRAAYPCQRVAAPLAGSFLVWLAGLGGASIAFGRARTRLREARYAAAGVALAVAFAGIGWTVLSWAGPVRAALTPLVAPAAYSPHPANAPIGAARGFAPGRVAWAHDPKVTTWDGSSTGSGQRWFEKISQSEATAMMQWAMLGYAGKGTTAEAWDAVFHHFNGGPGYRAGEKIFIKINLTTSNANGCADSNYNWIPGGCGATWTSVGPSPQLMNALLDQLVNVVGVAQSDITIGDSTGLWVNELYNPVHSNLPAINFLDARGRLGRTASTRSTTPIYWSTAEANGLKQDYLLQAIVNAKYVIDFAILKSHERAGITETAKNLFGSFSGGNSDERKPVTPGYYNWHLRLPLETMSGVWKDRALMAQYRPLVDMNAHAGMGGKTILYLLDAIYTGRGWSGIPSKWRVPPFCTSPGCASGTEFWPASLFLSMDPVAIDSVGFDFLSQRTDWTEVLQAEGVQDYLHEMALANNPLSGTFYDPEHDGKSPPSQGSHEHWNGVTLKQYSRNLGTGAGIDLIYLTGDPTKNAAVRRTDQAIPVDGSMDAPWNSAPVQTMGNVVLGGGSISGPSDLSASYRALYDDGYLYVLVDVTDERLVKDSAAWSDDDSVAILIDGDYSRGASYDGVNDFELGFRWQDNAINRGANSAPAPPGASFVMVATGAGYRLEVKLPLAGLGIARGYGRLFGLDVQVNDDDASGARDSKIAWWAKDNTSSASPSGFGAGRLEGPEKTGVLLSNEGTAVRLQWTNYAWNDTYEVHKSAIPYFTPDATTRVAELAAPQQEHLDGTAGNAAYYLVEARQGGLAVGSNRTGRFQFELVK